jgi:hypothetical protein
VVGEKDVASGGLAIRSRDLNADLGLLPIAEVIARLRSESRAPSLRLPPS